MKRILTILLLIITALPVWSQLTPMKSQYFQNPYLVNPAMAGFRGVTEVYSNYSNQWNKIEGAPEMLSFSGSMPINEKASIGVNVINDKAGLMQRTQAMGSYSYKVPFSADHSLRFGVSLSWSQDDLNYSLASGSRANDPELMRYQNERESYLDGNFGVAYMGKKLEAQFSYLNLNQRRNGQFSTVDYSTFYSAVSYMIILKNDFSVRPLLAYRGVKGYDNQYDIAAEWGIEDLKLYTMYHSNRSFSGGLGYTYKQQLNISTLYNTEPVAIRGFTGGVFDIVIGYRFNRKL
ncbi:PorP/SprF family type IX secretion system membrane protein [Pedobacter glucosidilyticus]|uniref:PorP/SprF family type IX secretion system membrane protein n=1 Tax=Pedobacter glucosidilyticus TaxID=1122941 RepID=UPI0026EE2CB7|nr:type IX secretion system membrane protein PorP/SprF [Pedobacter glucosidilyticus]